MDVECSKSNPLSVSQNEDGNYRQILQYSSAISPKSLPQQRSIFNLYKPHNIPRIVLQIVICVEISSARLICSEFRTTISQVGSALPSDPAAAYPDNPSAADHYQQYLNEGCKQFPEEDASEECIHLANLVDYHSDPDRRDEPGMFLCDMTLTLEGGE